MRGGPTTNAELTGMDIKRGFDAVDESLCTRNGVLLARSPLF